MKSESVLGIQCAPMTWPIGMGKRLKGVVHLVDGRSAPVRAGPQLHPPGLDHLLLDRRSAPGRTHRRRHAGRTSRRARAGAGRIAPLRQAAPTSPASRRRCSSARRSTTSACSCCSTSSSSTHRRRSHARTTSREVAPEEEKLHRLRVQDPGQHGPAAPRPRRLPARVLGQVRSRHEGLPRAHRQGVQAGQRAHLHGQRPRASSRPPTPAT